MPRDVFGKVLIANRGEIACRLIRAARRLQLETVAVYSTPDARAPHVLLADEAVHIGPAPAASSYLDGRRVINAARQTGARAVHPGYGFLSENAAFVKLAENAGVAFVGPPATAIENMGDKIVSKRIAAASGVNVIPGFVGEIKSEEQAVEEARKITYPVMVKASAGGGGKGMRVARSDRDMRDAFRLSKAEAMKAFGDDRMLIEKYVEKPRHIEIQIIADKYGNVVHLGERECSIQRRNQKIIEESPSPFVDDAMRRAMGEQAIALARAVNYSSAGTVECLVSGVDRSFYFLEMNTRLQVEHPVTEAVTGHDLAELMFRIAAGEKLPFNQDDVEQRGWSMEGRVYAENPFRGFLPSSGTIFGYLEPPNARIDSGVTDGTIVESYYDPILSKVVTHGKTREEAIDALQSALDSYVVNGFQTNIPFLRAVTRNSRFRSGLLSTHFVDEEYPDGFKAGIELSNDELKEALIITGKLYFDKKKIDLLKALGSTKSLGGTKSPQNPSQVVEFEAFDMTNQFLARGELKHLLNSKTDEKEFPETTGMTQIALRGMFTRKRQAKSGMNSMSSELEDTQKEDDEYVLRINSWKCTTVNGGDAALVETTIVSQKDQADQFGNQKRRVLTRVGSAPFCGTGLWKVWYHGALLRFCMGQSNEENIVREMGGWDTFSGANMDGMQTGAECGTVRAPMTGNIISVAVQVGDAVVEGQEIAIIEAMKMQNSVRSNVTGVVSEVRVKADMAVGLDEVLASIKVTAGEQQSHV